MRDRRLSEDTAFDASRLPVDTSPIRALVSLIVERCRPVSVWLFGSRARGEARNDSDWDLLVVLPDNVAEEDVYSSLSPWRLRKLTRVNADVVYCNDSEFAEATSVSNTLAYEVAKHGLVIA
jgi:predicted nucleotidyltransferase